MTDNENLELKKRSRRRLVGAAALALLAAIVLPMVMDQEPAPTAQDIQVSIPDHDADNASTRPIAGRPGQSADAQLPPPPDEDAPGNAPAADSAVAPDAPAAGPVAATPTPSVPPASTPRASPPAADAAPPASNAKPAVAAVTPPKDEAARVRALLEGVPAPTKESFVVQVGAFGEPAKAASLIADLKGRGLSAYSEKAGNVTRVRVGPFASRDQAEKAAERLRANGLNGVVAPR